MTTHRIDLERVRPILERLVRAYGDPDTLAEAIAAHGSMSKETARRRLYTWMTPGANNSRHRKTGELCAARYADVGALDNVLTALGMNYLWHTDLYDEQEAA